MADKEKRIQKILSKMGWKGKLKSVATLEEATVVVVEDPRDKAKNMALSVQNYPIALKRFGSFPTDRVHFLTSTNPRNKDLVERGLISQAKGLRNIPS